MANPGKHLDCTKLDWFFDVAGDLLIVQEVVFIGSKVFQMNGYGIEVV